MMRKLVFILMLFASPIWAVEPDEVLDDPLLEIRARALSKQLRCLQCQNENIDESNAEIARDLRLLVRERLVEGDSDSAVIDYIVARYGEFVLLRPNGRGANIILWTAGPTLFLVTLGALFLTRRQKRTQSAKPLSAEEENLLKKIIEDDV